MEKQTELKELSFEEAVVRLHNGYAVTIVDSRTDNKYDLFSYNSSTGVYNVWSEGYGWSTHRDPYFLKTVCFKTYLGDVRDLLKEQASKAKEEDRFKELDESLDNINWTHAAKKDLKEFAREIVKIVEAKE